MLKSVMTHWETQEDFNFYMAILSHQFNFVFRHSERVACYAVTLARHIGCTDEEIVNIGAAALLHDIGKMNVPIKVLYKQGIYDRYDRSEMERHPVYGGQILLRSKEMRHLTDSVLYHHEWYDGTGYPKKLHGEEIPLPARIIHIVEAFDVMTTVQNYQQWKNRDMALAELKCKAGSQFDPRLVDIFVSLGPDIINKISPARQFIPEEESDEVVLPDSISHYMANISNLGIICLDKNNTVVFCNPYAEKMRQLPAGELFGKNFLENYPQHRRTILEEKLSQLKTGEKTEWYRLMGRGGKFIENRYSRVTDAAGKYIGTVLVTIDVTERERVNRMLNMALERQSALYQAAQIIASAFNIAEVIKGILKIVIQSMAVRQAAICLLEEPGNDIAAVYPESSRENCLADCRWAVPVLRNSLKTLATREGGNIIKYHIPLVFRETLLGVLYMEKVCQGEDYTERLQLLEALASQTAVAVHNARLHEEVQYLAEYDKLTGLFNRHSFDKQFSGYCLQADLKKLPLTLLMIDINGLKAVNDRLGHVAGDLLIRETAHIITKSIRADDCAFRYGGDEIVVIIPGILLEQSRIIIKRIQHSVSRWRYKDESGELSLSVSIGAADNSEVSSSGLVQTADARMYENKRRHYQVMEA